MSTQRRPPGPEPPPKELASDGQRPAGDDAGESYQPPVTVLRQRRRLPLRDELVLASLPTLVTLGMLVFLETVSDQRLLFTSLSASSFLIYLDPHHGMNTVRRIVFAHLTAALAGMLGYLIFSHGFPSGAFAVLTTILVMIGFNQVHPPAVATSLIFSLRAGQIGSFALFALALVAIAMLVGLQRAAVWMLARLDPEGLGQ